MDKKKYFDIGYMGEMYVMFKLASLNIKAVNLQNYFDYDIITYNSCKIEVKTSSVIVDKDKRRINYNREIYQFLNHKRISKYSGTKKMNFTNERRDRNCDIFVLVCLDEFMTVESTYVVPKEIIGNRQIITIPRNPTNKARLKEYKEMWDLIE